MGKCSICNRKIEYNKYKVVNGDVYCPDCVPKTSFEKAADPEEKEIPCATLDEVVRANEAAAEERNKVEEEVAKAEEEAKEQFEKEMAGHGDSTETDRNEPEPEEKPKRKRGRKKNANL